jgi:glycosyltransferase involved in cell wall biosynthesis
MHSPGNSATTQVVAHAFPDQRVRVLAETSHISELKSDPFLSKLPNIEFLDIPAYDDTLRGKLHIVSFRRMAREFRILARAIRAVEGDENIHVFLLSATSTAIFVCGWLLRLFRGRTLTFHIGLHGNLNDIRGWRPLNPLKRRYDMRSALTARRHNRLRFLVLDESIRDEMIRILPTAGRLLDVLPLPLNPNEVGLKTPLGLSKPVRIGFVGLATRAKGIDVFLEVARTARKQFGDRFEFHLVGRLQQGTELPPLDVLAHHASHKMMSREEFKTHLAKLHYIMLPFRSGYYNLSASGAIIDALVWEIPIIATRVPLVERLFAHYGNIGYLCDDGGDLIEAIEDIAKLNPAHYDKQVAAIVAAGRDRLPQNLAPRYRAMLLHSDMGFSPVPRQKHSRENIPAMPHPHR